MLAQQCCFSINVHILLILYIHKTEKNVFLCLLNYQEDISSTSLVTLNSKKHPISTVLPNVSFLKIPNTAVLTRAWTLGSMCQTLV